MTPPSSPDPFGLCAVCLRDRVAETISSTPRQTNDIHSLLEHFSSSNGPRRGVLLLGDRVAHDSASGSGSGCTPRVAPARWGACASCTPKHPRRQHLVAMATRENGQSHGHKREWHNIRFCAFNHSDGTGELGTSRSSEPGLSARGFLCTSAPSIGIACAPHSAHCRES